MANQLMNRSLDSCIYAETQAGRGQGAGGRGQAEGGRKPLSWWCNFARYHPPPIPFQEVFRHLLSFSCKLGEEVEAKVAEPTAA